jgi:hypothetical protein
MTHSSFGHMLDCVAREPKRATVTLITVTEAHERFGDLARIRNGVTTWVEVNADCGVWRPVFEGGVILAGYSWSET